MLIKAAISKNFLGRWMSFLAFRHPVDKAFRFKQDHQKHNHRCKPEQSNAECCQTLDETEQLCTNSKDHKPVKAGFN